MNKLLTNNKYFRGEIFTKNDFIGIGNVSFRFLTIGGFREAMVVAFISDRVDTTIQKK